MRKFVEGALAGSLGLVLGVGGIKLMVLFFAHCPAAKAVMDWAFRP